MADCAPSGRDLEVQALRGGLPPVQVWVERVVLLVAVALVAAFTVTTVPGVRAHSGYSFRLDGVLANAAYFAPCVLALVRVLRTGWDRRAWLLLAAALTVYEAGGLYWTVAIRPLDPQPFPSLADVLWLASYPLLYGCLLLLLRRQVRGIGVSAWLDGVICGLGAATVTSAFLLGPVLSTLGGPFATVAVNLAYPIADLLLVGFLVTSTALLGWRPSRGAIALGVGFLIFALVDVVYLVQVAHGSYVQGRWVDALWPIGFLLMALGVGSPLTRTAVDRRRRELPGLAALVVPIGWVFLSGLIATLDTFLHLPEAISWLAFATLTVGTLRMVLAFVELRSLAESRLEARTDPLTGLPNRRALYEAAEGLLRPSATTVGRLALLILDLDRFKEVNDSLGHHMGDQLLSQIGPRIQGVLRAGDVLARLGGDEFALLLPGADAADAQAVAGRVLDALRQPFQLDQMGLHIDASIGIALSPEHPIDVNGLLQRADIALYQAKAQRGTHATYDLSTTDPSRDRLQTIEELRVAVVSDNIVLHYQPKATLPAGAVHSVEALVRWWHPERGLRYPDSFLPLVEQAGLMHALTDRVLGLALDQVLVWRAEGLPALRVAVNLSASSIVDAGLPNRVAAALATRGLPGQVLSLEITEQFLMADRVRARQVLSELRGYGVQISIDDFGTGYSSLAYLRDLPIDELKLDRAFVAPLVDDARAANLVRSTIGLSHALGLRMVAEGVEDQATWDELVRYGCDELQGYHLARPMPGAQLSHWLAERLAGRLPFTRWDEPRSPHGRRPPLRADTSGQSTHTRAQEQPDEDPCPQQRHRRRSGPGPRRPGPRREDTRPEVKAYQDKIASAPQRT